jgi:hypothetical protein
MARKKTYAQKTGQNARGAVILAAAMFQKIETTEDDNGNVIRLWKSYEGNQFTNGQLRDILSNRVSVETNEFLGTVPPAAVKYCANKRFIIPAGADLWLVTDVAAFELKLPRKFTGGRFKGRSIPFAKG